ncbi:hypothetical protein HMPREF9370_1062 [Neisseria wadsworthii 9715]|uniref:Uncharacterized protein n=1 Tax=Neisseria wadsworthii 9715 TaxID=1030841 RepID=G4CPQ2_9NEIS|nr:hypothetical protein HMPREF9370_1062 [Neisseria wadsworthii 9715]
MRAPFYDKGGKCCRLLNARFDFPLSGSLYLIYKKDKIILSSDKFTAYVDKHWPFSVKYLCNKL